MWHTVLELMLLSIQLLSTQLSSTAAFSFVDCGILWNAALNTALCCSQYSVSLHFIQAVIQIIGDCNSKTTCEVVSWVGSLQGIPRDSLGISRDSLRVPYRDEDSLGIT